MMEEPETYLFSPTPYVPNSPLPVLIYRAVLEPASASQDGDAQALSADSLRNQIEQNKWRYGGVFKHYPTHHFHSVTHECYAVFKGRSRLLLGRGPLDEANDGHGKEVELRAGDIIVLPVSTDVKNRATATSLFVSYPRRHSTSTGCRCHLETDLEMIPGRREPLLSSLGGRLFIRRIIS
ncbi:hypothetical protein HRR80_000119 [Exophiala dermatitidis]|uniref:Uncharacterized protein n=1 Tax=Exophiala dermatitidis TaxID=5970 RepID=A0AAN6F2S3_EXODE|nr:hypothetical protein HRR76_008614 [Exophiala dermatitidis]KAJ4558097.1 hypothetical protein HRR77_000119 [Exophiala dermatitidis]KAJ4589802.1 hypothetical protein HRR82_000203 [Exophiala dermatitidis]KAJ4620885.1 hypothetical protein HRR85_001115 [Exophiala dermatitidis]KAJ4635602.1 hypothetical protein HRR86_000070 [Exophiala dermatitidis]